ncbi:hypothetical protein P280DRAFT_504463 [Massarina eburnea CBS 473.64]|uniref:Uncharacterized protein n=1 Tax=Massarina eburnea CBS 473.64 TaxID=1395130 RepID=A0A6A6SDR9_9PLEO|nr:hypothetical protein P280DRAFT_504463 [Massarina eburnea CBS 473.64]
MVPMDRIGTPLFEPEIGQYLLVGHRDRQQRPWPAIMIPDDLVPSASSRPYGFYHTVLLIKEVPEVCYALTRDLHPIEDMFPDSEEVSQTNGLSEAYGMLHEAIGSEMNGLDYWRMLIQSQNQHPDVSSSSSVDSDSEDEDDMREAIQRSLIEERKARGRTSLPTPSASPPLHQYEHGDIRNYTVAGPSSRPSHPTIQRGDVVEEMEDSKAFVQFLVGPERSRFEILSTKVFSRRYFALTHHGRMVPKGKEGWTINLPSLSECDPTDFKLAAQYLDDDEFGIRIITDENRDEAFAECVSAWDIADKLSMEDLLEHICDKMEYVGPWSSAEVLVFVELVYRTPGTPLDGYARMKDMLTEYIADNYYALMRDNHAAMTRRLKMFPELERDVMKKVMERAQRRIEVEEAEEWEVDE